MSKEDGGPAFPIVGFLNIEDGGGIPRLHPMVGNGGMSLRDYFAGMALQGLLHERPKVRIAGDYGEEAYILAAALGGSLVGRGFIVADCEKIGGAVVGSAAIKCEIVRGEKK